VTGVEIVIENCRPAVHKKLPDFRNRGKITGWTVVQALC